jgi:hypothetical protein
MRLGLTHHSLEGGFGVGYRYTPATGFSRGGSSPSNARQLATLHAESHQTAGMSNLALSSGNVGS